MFVYLLTSKTANLRSLRQTIEALGESTVFCCSTSALMSACMRGPGYIIVDGTEYTFADVREITEKIRTAGYANPVLVSDPLPTVEKAIEWMRVPVCDYFSPLMPMETLQLIFENAQEWLETVGEKTVTKFHYKRVWKSLDAGMRSVLKLLYDGYTNREVAENLSLSPRTIEARRAKLLDTFGVKTFAELIRVATLFMDE